MNYGEYASDAHIPVAVLKEMQWDLSREHGIPWRSCSTVIFINEKQPEHPEMPPWLNPYDIRFFEDPDERERRIRFGRKSKTAYESRIEVLALRRMRKTWQEVREERLWTQFKAEKQKAATELDKDIKAFLKGFTDVTGNYWCGHCYSQCQLMDMGQKLGYPKLWASQTEPGYTNWLHTARYAGIVTVESGLRLARKINSRAC